MTKNKALPSGISSVIAMLVCRDAEAEVEFCKATFVAAELNRRPGPDGRLAHALLSISGAHVMIEAEWPSLASRAPQVDGSSPVVIFVYVADVDSTFDRAVAAGAKILMPPQDQFWGDRTCRIMDPSGHVWTIATRVEETSAAERTKRWSAILETKS
jgi:PhnB protein